MKLVYLLLSIGLCVGAGTSVAAGRTVAFGGKDRSAFMIDGREVQIRAGQLDPQRIPRAYWRQRIQLAKDMGLNTVSSYFFWNDFEQRDGAFDLTNECRDVAAWLRICQEEGMYVLFRPGPYVCAEWDFGGIPPRFLKDGVPVRSSDPRFLKAALRYLTAIADIAEPYLAKNGGPIILTQIENEYGSWPFKDVSYLADIRDFWKARGFGPFYMADGAGDRFLKDLIYPDKEIAVGFDPAMNEKAWAFAAKYNPGVPVLSAETYPGWLRHWGEGNWAPSDITAAVRWFMEGRRSFCMFVVHGGTSFGFTAGANDGGEGGFEPDLTSYDYGAPIDEQGRPTAAFHAYRRIICEALGETPPPVPAEIPSMAFAEVIPQRLANLRTAFSACGMFAHPPCLETFDQNQGLVSYQTQLPAGPAAELVFERVADYAQIELDGRRLVRVDRRLKRKPILIPARDKPAELEILVEAMGHINFGKGMKDDRKGLIGDVRLGNVILTEWRVARDPLAGDAVATIAATADDGRAGGRFRAVVTLETVADTFIDMSAWGKGTLYVNGRNLGRYWNVGPQESLYCPAPFLKKGANQIDIVEMEQRDARPIRGLPCPHVRTKGAATRNAACLSRKMCYKE